MARSCPVYHACVHDVSSLWMHINGEHISRRSFLNAAIRHRVWSDCDFTYAKDGTTAETQRGLAVPAVVGLWWTVRTPIERENR